MARSWRIWWGLLWTRMGLGTRSQALAAHVLGAGHVGPSLVRWLSKGRVLLPAVFLSDADAFHRVGRLRGHACVVRNAR